MLNSKPGELCTGYNVLIRMDLELITNETSRAAPPDAIHAEVENVPKGNKY